MVVWRRTVLAAAALAASLVAGAAHAAPKPATAVGASAREYRLALYRATVPRGPVRFNLTNYGEDVHDLVVRDRTGRQLARSGEVRAGERTTLALRLRPGRYVLVCDVADHEHRGMRSSLRVTR
jgi:cupredoxin-like protein